MRAQTERLVRGLDDLFARTRADNPGFDGRTVMVVTPTADGQMSVFSDTDARGRLIANLGFRQPAAVADVVGDEFYAYLSPEKFDLLDVDALLVLGYDRPSVAALNRMATYQQLDVVRRGGAVVVGDMDTAMALAAGTVTSIPWAIDRVVPQLRAALAKARRLARRRATGAPPAPPAACRSPGPARRGRRARRPARPAPRRRSRDGSPSATIVPSRIAIRWVA